jgi:hypothetical protein
VVIPEMSAALSGWILVLAGNMDCISNRQTRVVLRLQGIFSCTLITQCPILQLVDSTFVHFVMPQGRFAWPSQAPAIGTRRMRNSDAARAASDITLEPSLLGLGLGLGLLQRPAVARSWSHPGSWDFAVKD